MGKQTAMRTDQYNSRWLNGTFLFLAPKPLTSDENKISCLSMIHPVIKCSAWMECEIDVHVKWNCQRVSWIIIFRYIMKYAFFFHSKQGHLTFKRVCLYNPSLNMSLCHQLRPLIHPRATHPWQRWEERRQTVLLLPGEVLGDGPESGDPGPHRTHLSGQYKIMIHLWAHPVVKCHELVTVSLRRKNRTLFLAVELVFA